MGESAELPQESASRVTGDVTIITVQYNNFSDTVNLVASLANVEGSAKCELVVVDNSTLAEATMDLATLSALAPYPVHLLQPPENLYYWGGAEFALKSLYSSSDRRPQWVIICNNDVTIEDPFFLRRLRSLDPAKYPIVAPGIISVATGKDQNPLLQSPAGPLKRLKWRMYDLDYRVARALLVIHSMTTQLFQRFARSPRRRVNPAPQRMIYAPHGAFMIFSAAFFERGGTLDTTVPMFAEELTIAALARRLDLPIWYCPELQVFHREHSTTGARLTRTKYEMERLSRQHYFGLGRGVN